MFGKQKTDFTDRDFEIAAERKMQREQIERDDKVVAAMERAAARHDKRELTGWLKAFAREDRAEQRRFEKEMMRD